MRSTEPDIVREQGGAIHIAIAVDGVDAPDDGNPVLHRGRVVGLGQRVPVGRAGVFVPLRPTATAIEHRTQVVAAYILRRGGLDFWLGHLAHLLGQRHAGNHGVDARFHGRVGEGQRGAGKQAEDHGDQ
jgi:hypothetical protein